MTPARSSFLFGDLPFYDRIDAAASNGFRAVEFMFPYDYDVSEIGFLIGPPAKRSR